MGKSPKTQRIGLVQCNPRVAEEMEKAIREKGLEVSSYVPHDWMEMHRDDILSFIESWMPDLLVYEIPTPFARNWEQCQQILSTPLLNGKPFLITTVERNILANVAGTVPYMEIRGLPFEAEVFMRAITRLLETGGNIRLIQAPKHSIHQVPKQNIA